MQLVIKAIIVVAILSFALNFAWQHKVDAVVIDDTYSFTHNDISSLYALETRLGKIIGSSVVNFEIDVLYNLIISSIQKTI